MFSYIDLRAYFLAVVQYLLNITLFILRARTHLGTFINAVSMKKYKLNGQNEWALPMVLRRVLCVIHVVLL